MTRKNSTPSRARLTPSDAETIKALAVSNAPYVRGIAVVGHAFWSVMVANLQGHGRRDVAVFDDDATALDWLVAH